MSTSNNIQPFTNSVNSSIDPSAMPMNHLPGNAPVPAPRVLGEAKRPLEPTRVSSNPPAKSRGFFAEFLHRHFSFYLTKAEKKDREYIKTTIEMLDKIILELKTQGKENKRFTEKLNWKLPTQATMKQNAQRLKKAEVTLSIANGYLKQLENHQSTIDSLVSSFNKYSSLPSEIIAIKKEIEKQRTELAIAQSFHQMEEILFNYDSNKTWEQFQTVREGTTAILKSFTKNLDPQPKVTVLSLEDAAKLISRKHPNLSSKMDLLHANLMTVQKERFDKIKAKATVFKKLIENFKKQASVVSLLETQQYQRPSTQNKAKLETAQQELKTTYTKIQAEGSFLQPEIEWLGQTGKQHSDANELYQEVRSVEVSLGLLKARDQVADEMNNLIDSLAQYDAVKKITELTKTLKNNNQTKLDAKAIKEQENLKNQIISQIQKIAVQLDSTLQVYVDTRKQIKNFDKLTPLEKFQALNQSYTQLGVRSQYIVDAIRVQGLTQEVNDAIANLKKIPSKPSVSETTPIPTEPKKKTKQPKEIVDTTPPRSRAPTPPTNPAQKPQEPPASPKPKAFPGSPPPVAPRTPPSPSPVIPPPPPPPPAPNPINLLNEIQQPKELKKVEPVNQSEAPKSDDDLQGVLSRALNQKFYNANPDMLDNEEDDTTHVEIGEEWGV